MAQLLDVSINYFFWGLSDLDFSTKSKLRTSDVINLDADAIRSVIQLSTITDTDIRTALQNLIKSASKAEDYG